MFEAYVMVLELFVPKFLNHLVKEIEASQHANCPAVMSYFGG